MNLNKHIHSILIVLLLISLSSCNSTNGDIPIQNITNAKEKVYPALVQIGVVTTTPSAGRLLKFQSAGSGAIFSIDGYVITNHHVAGHATQLVCRMPDGEEIDADLVGTDALSDIAVLKLRLDERKNKSLLPYVTFGNSDEVQVGDVVFALGSPSALSQSITQGIISNKKMVMPKHFANQFTLDGENVGSIVRWFGHDAVIFGGNSGGPLVNVQGEVIGINEIGIGSLGGAIPSNVAKSVANDLVKYGRVKRSWTGIECQPRLKDSIFNKGVLVSGVINKSPAKKAGIKPGDIIVKYNNVPVNCQIDEDLPKVNRLMLSTPVGQEVEVVLWRNGQEKKLSLTTVDREPAQRNDIEVKSWGMTVRNLTLMASLENKRPNKKGVYISTLRQAGPANEAKPALQGRDMIIAINGQAVNNVEDLVRISNNEISKSKKVERVPILVSFERKSQKMMTVVKIGNEAPKEKPFLSRRAWFPAATQVLTKDLAKALGIKGKKGVRVTQVYKNHSAEKAGIKIGDILLKMDDEIIDASQPEDNKVLFNMIRQYKVGHEVVFDVLRDKNTMKLNVKLEQPPTPSSELKRYTDEDFELTIREVSFNQTIVQEDGFQGGVYIEEVKRAGWAALAKMSAGDIIISINNQPVSDIVQAEKILKKSKNDKLKSITFFIKRGIHTKYLVVEPLWK